MKQRVLQTLNILRNYYQMTPPDKLSPENSQGKPSRENPEVPWDGSPQEPHQPLLWTEAEKDGFRSSRTDGGAVSLSTMKLSMATKPGSSSNVGFSGSSNLSNSEDSVRRFSN